MHNQVTKEQCLAVVSSKRMAVSQASLKSMREEAGAQLYNSDNKHLTL